MNHKIDVHKAKGLKTEKAVKRLLRATGYADAVIFANGIADVIARSERAKARERKKRADKHAATVDMFRDS